MALAAGVLAGACGSQNSSSGGEGDSPLQEARAHYQRALAESFDHPADEIVVLPKKEGVVNSRAKYDVEDLLALEAKVGDYRARGFATADGDVVFLKIGDLEPLMRAARILDPDRSLSALEIARRIAWMYTSDELVEEVGDYRPMSGQLPDDVAPPGIDRPEDGSARLRFLTIKAGDTGSLVPYEIIVRVSNDYETEMSRAVHE